jgi:5-methylthioadenosine/S-adenosylhomocysteine deaminase
VRVELVIRQCLVDGEVRDIGIADGKIAFVRAPGEATAAPDAAPDPLPLRVVDGRGLHAFPGLKNGHTHAAMTLFRGYGDDLPLMEWLRTRIWPAEALLTEEDIYHGTRLGIVEMIRSGTTYFNDMYWHRAGVLRAVEELGVRSHVGSVFIDHGDPTGVAAGALRDAVLQQVAERHTLNPRIQVSVAPHAIYTVSPESLEWIAGLAAQDDLVVHIHLSETWPEVEACVATHGVKPAFFLQRLGLLGPNLVLAHGVYLDAEEMELLAEHDVTVVTNPIANMKLATGGIFDYRTAKAAGLRVALGTDGAGSNNNLDLIEEMKVLALVQKHRAQDPTVLTAHDALELATTAPARSFRLGSGRLEAGAPADLILVDLSHASTQPVHDPVSALVYAANGGAVHTTICDGRVLMHDRRVEVVDEAEVVASAVAAAERLAARA